MWGADGGVERNGDCSAGGGRSDGIEFWRGTGGKHVDGNADFGDQQQWVPGCAYGAIHG